MPDDMLTQLDQAARLGLELCGEAVACIRKLEDEMQAARQHAVEIAAASPLVIQDSPLIVQVAAERFVDKIATDTDLRGLMARCGMDAELTAIRPDGRGMVAVVTLYGAGFGASALLRAAALLDGAKP